MFAHGLSIVLTLAATLTAAGHPISASNGPLRHSANS